MYRGLRDNHVPDFIVPQYLCERYIDTNNREWIEIKLPGARNDMWESWVVRPEQVFYKSDAPNILNVIEGVNYDTDILITRKRLNPNTGKRTSDPNADYNISSRELLSIYKNDINRLFKQVWVIK